MSERESYIPSHPSLFQVDFKPGNYCSGLIACKGFEAGEVMTYLTGLTKSPRTYATMQCGPGPDDHLSLNSDLLYVNHSCDPNTAFELSSPDQSKWHIYALKQIAIGETLTFFYPSTEWLMDQPFDCTCGAPLCLRRIEGAAILPREDLLARGGISPWISDAIQQRDNASS
ncbi:hypothetical protein EI94DRAFT_1724466 [Lactarius quietus]|nr:hypothetical protein EI94DRAFT_1724466 [Lactarius quietus]